MAVCRKSARCRCEKYAGTPHTAPILTVEPVTALPLRAARAKYKRAQRRTSDSTFARNPTETRQSRGAVVPPLFWFAVRGMVSHPASEWAWPAEL